MSEKKLLLDVADGLRSLANSVQAVAEAITMGEPIRPTVQETPTAEPKTTVKAVSLEAVRAVLAEKSQAGFTAEVRGLLEKYGALKLSQIDPANYVALLADAEGLK